MHNPLTTQTLAELRCRTSMKWRRYDADVLPLWVAEMDVDLATPIVEAVTDAMALGDTGYPAGTAYAEAINAFAAERWGWSFDIDRSAIVPDVMQGIVEMLHLVTEPGDPVVINPPVYPPFYEFIEHAGRRVVQAPLGADHRLDLERLDAVFAETVAGTGGGQAAYLLCSPHNPTGTVHTRDELTAVARLAEAHRVRVVVDEIHAPLALPGAQHIPYLSLPDTGNAFALLSASKAWNLAGLKAALAIAGPDAADELKRMPEIVGHGPSHVGILGHTAAFRASGEWLDCLLAGLDHNRALLGNLLHEHLPEVGYRQPAATFLTWLDCRGLDLGPDPAARFLERGRVALNSGLDFGSEGSEHVRLNIGTSPDIITEAVRRMASSV